MEAGGSGAPDKLRLHETWPQENKSQGCKYETAIQAWGITE